mmetsp:Transcript_54724/g.111714  ORF Transcript_54724/g.111714 Transcript_54724/m.111714 type:complete len:143 (+) Transcript_54724:30-458(+)
MHSHQRVSHSHIETNSPFLNRLAHRDATCTPADKGDNVLNKFSRTGRLFLKPPATASTTLNPFSERLQCEATVLHCGCCLNTRSWPCKAFLLQGFLVVARHPCCKAFLLHHSSVLLLCHPTGTIGPSAKGQNTGMSKQLHTM